MNSRSNEKVLLFVRSLKRTCIRLATASLAASCNRPKHESASVFDPTKNKQQQQQQQQQQHRNEERSDRIEKDLIQARQQVRGQ